MATVSENAKVLTKFGRELKAIIELADQIVEAENLAKSAADWKAQIKALHEESESWIGKAMTAQEDIAAAKTEAQKIRKDANEYAKVRKANVELEAEAVLAKANSEASEAFAKAKEAVEELDKRVVAARDELDTKQAELNALEKQIEKAKAAAQKLLKDVG